MKGFFMVFIVIWEFVHGIKGEIEEVQGRFCVKSIFGDGDVFMCPVIDLANNSSFLLGRYSGEREKGVYDPRDSTSALFADRDNDCQLTKFKNQKDIQFCENEIFLNDNSKLKLVILSDHFTVPPEKKKIKINFYCYENNKNDNDRDFEMSVFGFGPGKDSIFEQVTKIDESINAFKISFKDKYISFVKEKEPKSYISFSKSFNQYNINITDIKINDSSLIRSNQIEIYLNTLAQYSSFTPNIYFNLLRSIKQYLKSKSDPINDPIQLCYPQQKINSSDFPDLQIYFSQSYITWKPEQYTYPNENLTCLGIIPSFQNYLGLNFLSSREISIFYQKAQISITDLINQSEDSSQSEISKNQDPENSSDSENTTEDSTTSTNSSQPVLKEKNSKNFTSSNFFIFFVCVMVILAQIAAGYFFLTRNRNPRLEDPGIDLPRMSSIS